MSRASTSSFTAAPARPRVMHVLAPGHEGGLERVVTMLADGQAGASRDGVHVVAVIDPAAAGAHPFVTRLKEQGIPVTEVAVGGREYLREYRALRALVQSVRPRVVHTHGYRADVIADAVARRLGIATVSTVHGFTGGSRKNRLNERIQCFSLRSAGAVVAVSRPLVDQLARRGIATERIHCVPNGYQTRTDLMTRAEARARLGIPANALVAGWVGRLSMEKGADVMLDALAQTPAPWQLSVLGDGRESSALGAQATALGLEDRVTWHGSVASAARYLAAFDAFVLSSRTEGTPIALLEAMSAGIPLAVTRVGGVPDVVGDDEALVVAPEDPGALARALTIVRDQPGAAARRVAAAQRRLELRFGYQQWMESLDAVYRVACSS